jgi:hypothetical protein
LAFSKQNFTVAAASSGSAPGLFAKYWLYAKLKQDFYCYALARLYSNSFSEI